MAKKFKWKRTDAYPGQPHNITTYSLGDWSSGVRLMQVGRNDRSAHSVHTIDGFIVTISRTLKPMTISSAKKEALEDWRRCMASVEYFKSMNK